MEDLLYDEFDFSQYDTLANINAILEEIAQKNLDIEGIADNNTIRVEFDSRGFNYASTPLAVEAIL